MQDSDSLESTGKAKQKQQRVEKEFDQDASEAIINTKEYLNPIANQLKQLLDNGSQLSTDAVYHLWHFYQEPICFALSEHHSKIELFKIFEDMAFEFAQKVELRENIGDESVKTKKAYCEKLDTSIVLSINFIQMLETFMGVFEAFFSEGDDIVLQSFLASQYIRIFQYRKDIVALNIFHPTAERHVQNHINALEQEASSIISTYNTLLNKGFEYFFFPSDSDQNISATALVSQSEEYSQILHVLIANIWKFTCFHNMLIHFCELTGNINHLDMLKNSIENIDTILKDIKHVFELSQEDKINFENAKKQHNDTNAYLEWIEPTIQAAHKGLKEELDTYSKLNNMANNDQSTSAQPFDKPVSFHDIYEMLESMSNNKSLKNDKYVQYYEKYIRYLLYTHKQERIPDMERNALVLLGKLFLEMHVELKDSIQQNKVAENIWHGLYIRMIELTHINFNEVLLKTNYSLEQFQSLYQRFNQNLKKELLKIKKYCDAVPKIEIKPYDVVENTDLLSLEDTAPSKKKKKGKSRKAQRASFPKQAKTHMSQPEAPNQNVGDQQVDPKISMNKLPKLAENKADSISSSNKLLDQEAKAEANREELIPADECKALNTAETAQAENSEIEHESSPFVIETEVLDIIKTENSKKPKKRIKNLTRTQRKRLKKPQNQACQEKPPEYQVINAMPDPSTIEQMAEAELGKDLLRDICNGIHAKQLHLSENEIVEKSAAIKAVPFHELIHLLGDIFFSGNGVRALSEFTRLKLFSCIFNLHDEAHKIDHWYSLQGAHYGYMKYLMQGNDRSKKYENDENNQLQLLGILLLPALFHYVVMSNQDLKQGCENLLNALFARKNTFNQYAEEKNREYYPKLVNILGDIYTRDETFCAGMQFESSRNVEGLTSQSGFVASAIYQELGPPQVIGNNSAILTQFNQLLAQRHGVNCHAQMETTDKPMPKGP